jgi:hypothetical protein
MSYGVGAVFIEMPMFAGMGVACHVAPDANAVFAAIGMHVMGAGAGMRMIGAYIAAAGRCWRRADGGKESQQESYGSEKHVRLPQI